MTNNEFIKRTFIACLTGIDQIFNIIGFVFFHKIHKHFLTI